MGIKVSPAALTLLILVMGSIGVYGYFHRQVQVEAVSFDFNAPPPQMVPDLFSYPTRAQAEVAMSLDRLDWVASIVRATVKAYGYLDIISYSNRLEEIADALPYLIYSKECGREAYFLLWRAMEIAAQPDFTKDTHLQHRYVELMNQAETSLRVARQAAPQPKKQPWDPSVPVTTS